MKSEGLVDYFNCLNQGASENGTAKKSQLLTLAFISGNKGALKRQARASNGDTHFLPAMTEQESTLAITRMQLVTTPISWSLILDFRRPASGNKLNIHFRSVAPRVLWS